MTEPLDLAQCIARAAASRKATDLIALDLSGIVDVCDYFVICSANTARQADAVMDAIEERCCEDLGAKPFALEGREQKRWILMDYGSVVVHIFLPEVREYYRLERLWGDAPALVFDEEAGALVPAPAEIAVEVAGDAESEAVE